MIDASTHATAAHQYLRSVVVLDDDLLPELGEDHEGDQSVLRGQQEFVSAFASSGLIAMPAVPTWSATDPDATQRFEEVGWLCGRADVIVLDWDMPNPDGDDGAGETAVRLIRLLTEPPNATLRLIVIYSRGVRDGIAARLDAELGTANNGGFWTKGPASVAVIRKAGGISDPDRDEEDPASSIEELPERLTSLFDSIISGIVPSTVVTALAASRNRAGGIIS